MSYHVRLAKKVRKKLKKMDPSVAAFITKWLRENLEGTDDPRRHGKALSGNHRGEWRYRVGSYRLIADIQDDKIVILIIDVGHRADIYQ